jgi:dsDNA-specific endonuclease/ATPase MutS2
VENELKIEFVAFDRDLVKIQSENYSDKIIYKDSIDQISKQPRIVVTPEIDLHIDDNEMISKRISSNEILHHQVRKADVFIQKMIENREHKFVLIHGVGEGILKNEIKFLLTKYAGVSSRDADFNKYGFGATQVEVNYNLR